MNKTIQVKVSDAIVWAVSLLFAFGLLLNEALAAPGAQAAAGEKWKTECGSCHLAYPPGLLPASSWRRIMAGLDRHFGTDASLDAASAAEIGALLERNAGNGKRLRDDESALRITETRWFRHKHDEVRPSAWKNPQVRTAANCSACHAGAEQGDFDEHGVRIPR